MAFNDTLFQLGMDLTRSSPAQKEDRRAPARTARTALGGSNAGHHGSRHLIIDLYGARKLDDIRHVERTLKRCVEAAGATLLGTHLHRLKPTGGVAGVAVLAESHISIHSWPETGYAALDVFMSGDVDAARAIPVLREAFAAGEVRVTAHVRGGPARKAKPAPAARPRTPRKPKAA